MKFPRATRHIDEGFNFLGFHIRRRFKRGSRERYIYTIPSSKAVASARARIKALTSTIKHPDFGVLLIRLNRFLRGWSSYFQYGVSSQVFDTIRHYTWHRVARWLRRERQASWKTIRRRYMHGWEFRTTTGLTLHRPQVAGVRYLYRGRNIPTPWTPKPA